MTPRTLTTLALALAMAAVAGCEPQSDGRAWPEQPSGIKVTPIYPEAIAVLIPLQSSITVDTGGVAKLSAAFQTGDTVLFVRIGGHTYRVRPRLSATVENMDGRALFDSSSWRWVAR